MFEVGDLAVVRLPGKKGLFEQQCKVQELIHKSGKSSVVTAIKVELLDGELKGESRSVSPDVLFLTGMLLPEGSERSTITKPSDSVCIFAWLLYLSEYLAASPTAFGAWGVDEILDP